MPAGADPRVARLTVENLITMQAGLERTSGANYGAWVSSRNWVADALSRPFEAEPGTRMLYSTGSYHVLGALLAETTGQSLLQLARSRLGAPLDMPFAPWVADPQGYYLGGNDMATTPGGLLRFAEMIRQDGSYGGSRVIARDWIEDSFRPRTRSPWSGLDYGLGWFLGRAGGTRYALARGPAASAPGASGPRADGPGPADSGSGTAIPVTPSVQEDPPTAEDRLPDDSGDVPADDFPSPGPAPDDPSVPGTTGDTGPGGPIIDGPEPEEPEADPVDLELPLDLIDEAIGDIDLSLGGGDAPAADPADEDIALELGGLDLEIPLDPAESLAGDIDLSLGGGDAPAADPADEDIALELGGLDLEIPLDPVESLAGDIDLSLSADGLGLDADLLSDANGSELDLLGTDSGLLSGNLLADGSGSLADGLDGGDIPLSTGDLTSGIDQVIVSDSPDSGGSLLGKVGGFGLF